MNYKDFITEFFHRKGTIHILIITSLVACGESILAGLAPNIIADRYARIKHSYDDDDESSCYTYNHEDKPIECQMGSDDAQIAASWSNAISSLLSFICNPIIGSLSDIYGRKIMIVLSIILSSLPSLSFIILLSIPTCHPIIYYIAMTLMTVINYLSISFAALSDVLVVVDQHDTTTSNTTTTTNNNNNTDIVVVGNDDGDDNDGCTTTTTHIADNNHNNNTQQMNGNNSSSNDDNDDDDSHVIVNNNNTTITGDNELRNNMDNNNSNDADGASMMMTTTTTTTSTTTTPIPTTTTTTTSCTNNNNNNMKNRKELLSPGFGLVMSSFYCGVSIGPSLAVTMKGNPMYISIAAFILLMTALTGTVLFLPETLLSAIGKQKRTTAMTSTMTIATMTTATSTAADVVQQEDQEQPQRQPQQQQHDGNVVDNNRSSNIDTSSTNDARSNSHSYCSLLMRPLYEMSILTRNEILLLTSCCSFFSYMIFASDHTLILYYIEDQLNVRIYDIAFMFLLFGCFGILLQGVLLQPLIRYMGENNVLISTFVSGILHNFIYYIAKDKSAIYVGLIVSQWTKVNMGLLSAVASKASSSNEQGRIQGALSGVNAVASAVGPLSMQIVYRYTKQHNNNNIHHQDMFYGLLRLGPSFMWLYAAVLYGVGTILVVCIPNTEKINDQHHDNDDNDDNNHSNDNDNLQQQTATRRRSRQQQEQQQEQQRIINELEEPLLVTTTTTTAED